VDEQCNCSEEPAALPFPIQFYTCVQLRLITILGNCGCVAVATFLGVLSA
jgi:hypothetical protein